MIEPHGNLKPTAIPALPPSEIGEYRIVRTLTADQSYDALAPDGRRVVLKMLDADCLLRGKLHPNIRDRLARVRELAHPGIANLHGVERDGKRVFLVWAFVEGRTLEEFAATISSADEMSLLARELILIVESLHVLGIVHGAAHCRNIIVDARSQAHLTHVSPLLFDDPANDSHELIAALASIIERRNWRGSTLGKAVSEWTTGGLTMPQFRARLGGGVNPAILSDVGQSDRGIRRKILWTAVGTAVAGGIVAAGIAKFAASKIPKPPVPLEAPMRLGNAER